MNTLNFNERKQIYLEYLESKKKYGGSRQIILYTIFWLLLFGAFVFIGNSLSDGVFSYHLQGEWLGPGMGYSNPDGYLVGSYIDLAISIVIIIILITYIRFLVKDYKNKVKSIDPFIKDEFKGYKKQLLRKGLSVNINNDTSKCIKENYVEATSNINQLELKLSEYENLLNKGVITKEEYDYKRKQIIDKY